MDAGVARDVAVSAHGCRTRIRRGARQGRALRRLERVSGFLNETWTWSGTTWTKLSPATSPTARDLHAMAYDGVRKKIVLFGGVVASGKSYVPVNDTWTWDGASWSPGTGSSAPPGRWSHAMAYDAAHGRMVMFGGEINSTLYTDTWLCHTRGGSCSLDTDCGSGHCVDGVCCETTCGTCQACDRADPGVCT
jgi:hypothetical protein